MLTLVYHMRTRITLRTADSTTPVNVASTTSLCEWLQVQTYVRLPSYRGLQVSADQHQEGT